MEPLRLGLTIWEGEFEGLHSHWLCWTDAQNEIIPAGKERAERLAAQLRALGIEPEA